VDELTLPLHKKEANRVKTKNIRINPYKTVN